MKAILLLLLVATASAQYTVHAPIRIDSEVDFLVPTNGVTGGQGTDQDPYIIEGWEISGDGDAPIVILDTTSSVLIRDVKLTNGGDGLVVHGGNTIWVENVTVENVEVGINADVAEAYVSDAALKGRGDGFIQAAMHFGTTPIVGVARVEATGFGNGVYARGAEVTVDGLVHEGEGYRSTGVTAEGIVEVRNSVLSAERGIWVDNGISTTIEDNHITSSSQGIHVSSIDTEIEGNFVNATDGNGLRSGGIGTIYDNHVEGAEIGIYAEGLLTISSNTVANGSQIGDSLYGIRQLGVGNVLNNHVHNSSLPAMIIDPQAVGITVEGNRLFHNSDQKTDTPALKLHAEQSTVRYNRIAHNQGTAMSINAETAQVYDNQVRPNGAGTGLNSELANDNRGLPEDKKSTPAPLLVFALLALARYGPARI